MVYREEVGAYQVRRRARLFLQCAAAPDRQIRMWVWRHVHLVDVDGRGVLVRSVARVAVVLKAVCLLHLSPFGVDLLEMFKTRRLKHPLLPL